MYFFLYSIHFFVTKLTITGTASTFLYFGYTLIMVLIFFLFTGKTSCINFVFCVNNFLSILLVRGTGSPCLERSSMDRAVWVRALTEDIVLCSWVRHVTLTMPLSTELYKRVPANLMLGVPWNGLASHLVRSRNTRSRFILYKKKNRISSGSMGYLLVYRLDLYFQKKIFVSSVLIFTHLKFC